MWDVLFPSFYERDAALIIYVSKKKDEENHYEFLLVSKSFKYIQSAFHNKPNLILRSIRMNHFPFNSRRSMCHPGMKKSCWHYPACIHGGLTNTARVVLFTGNKAALMASRRDCTITGVSLSLQQKHGLTVDMCLRAAVCWTYHNTTVALWPSACSLNIPDSCSMDSTSPLVVCCKYQGGASMD